MIESCTEYEDERLELKCELARLGWEEYDYLRLIEVVLYSENFEKILVRRNNRTREKIDEIIKVYIRRIVLKRTEAEKNEEYKRNENKLIRRKRKGNTKEIKQMRKVAKNGSALER